MAEPYPHANASLLRGLLACWSVGGLVVLECGKMTSRQYMRILFVILTCAAALMMFSSIARAFDATLQWDPVEDARVNRYVVSQGDASRQYDLEWTVPAPATTLPLLNLTAGHRYFWSVRACGVDARQGDLCSDESDELVWFKPLRTAWTAPVDLLTTPVYSALFDALRDPEGREVSGEGVTYSDTRAGQSLAGIRPAVGETFPDLYPVAEALDGPLVKVGANAPGEWAEYSVTLATTSTLQPTLLYSSATTTGRILFTVAGVSWDVLLPPTGSFRNWVEITGPEVVIPAGEHILRASIIDAGADWYSLRFNRVEPVQPMKKPNKPRLEKLK